MTIGATIGWLIYETTGATVCWLVGVTTGATVCWLTGVNTGATVGRLVSGTTAISVGWPVGECYSSDTVNNFIIIFEFEGDTFVFKQLMNTNIISKCHLTIALQKNQSILIFHFNLFTYESFPK